MPEPRREVGGRCAMRTHAHVYGVHPNPEWAKTHGACTVCGFAVLLHLIRYAIDHGATATDALLSRLVEQ
jgi:hypothetical protein